MRLAGKVAIISGAASGMGAATARMFAREGAKVVIGDVLEQEGPQVADGIGAAARFEPLDVTQEEGWAAVVAATTRHFGKLDVLVNNAGIYGSEHVHIAYNASKAAVRLMPKSVAVQHAKDEIRANSVHPGVMPPMRTSGRTADPAIRRLFLCSHTRRARSNVVPT